MNKRDWSSKIHAAITAKTASSPRMSAASVGGVCLSAWGGSVECRVSGVEGGFDGEAAALEDVGVDHGSLDVFVAEEFLDGADIIACL